MSDPITVARDHFDSGAEIEPRRARREKPARAPRKPRRVNMPLWGFILTLGGAGFIGMHVGLAGIVILALTLSGAK